MTDSNRNRYTLIDFNTYPLKDILGILLQDKSTKSNIIYATDAYVNADPEATETAPILTQQISGDSPTVRIIPRVQKSLDEQTGRTKTKAEVFTPSWMVNQMNNNLDGEWFGRKDVFNHENEDNSWTPTTETVQFPDEKGHDWHAYVDSRRLEITCGEAPFLVSRYDAATGEILAIECRIGLLDRKLRVVNENAGRDDLLWWKYTLRAFQSVYGYEFQGDSLLIARTNLLLTFFDYYRNRFDDEPSTKQVKQIANVITWNLWQMDGLTGALPFQETSKEDTCFDLFDALDEMDGVTPKGTPVKVRIHDWRAKKSLSYNQLEKG